jgi:hypothetical protein
MHSTGDSFYFLEKAMGNVNKNNMRYIIGNSEDKKQICFVLKHHVYSSLPIDLKFTLKDK